MEVGEDFVASCGRGRRGREGVDHVAEEEHEALPALLVCARAEALESGHHKSRATSRRHLLRQCLAEALHSPKNKVLQDDGSLSTRTTPSSWAKQSISEALHQIAREELRDQAVPPPLPVALLPQTRPRLPSQPLLRSAIARSPVRGRRQPEFQQQTFLK